MAVPPEYQQEGLLAELEAILDRMTTLDQQADQMIGVLQERRTALISAAVTGKIDVRGWKPPEGENETRLSGGQEEVA